MQWLLRLLVLPLATGHLVHRKVNSTWHVRDGPDYGEPTRAVMRVTMGAIAAAERALVAAHKSGKALTKFQDTTESAIPPDTEDPTALELQHQAESMQQATAKKLARLQDMDIALEPTKDPMINMMSGFTGGKCFTDTQERELMQALGQMDSEFQELKDVKDQISDPAIQKAMKAVRKSMRRLKGEPTFHKLTGCNEVIKDRKQRVEANKERKEGFKKLFANLNTLREELARSKVPLAIKEIQKERTRTAIVEKAYKILRHFYVIMSQDEALAEEMREAAAEKAKVDDAKKMAPALIEGEAEEQREGDEDEEDSEEMMQKQEWIAAQDGLGGTPEVPQDEVGRDDGYWANQPDPIPIEEDPEPVASPAPSVPPLKPLTPPAKVITTTEPPRSQGMLKAKPAAKVEEFQCKPSWSKKEIPTFPLAVGTTEGMELGGSFSLAAWIFRADDSKDVGFETIFASDVTRKNEGLHFNLCDGKLCGGFFQNDCKGNYPVPKGAWVHVAFVYDSEEQRQYLYLKGMKDAECDGMPALTAGANLVSLGRTTAWNTFDGQIQLAEVFKCPVPENQVLHMARAIQTSCKVSWEYPYTIRTKPFTIGPANLKGIGQRSWTALAWVMRPIKDLDAGTQTIIANEKREYNKGLNLLIKNGKLHMGFFQNGCQGNMKVPKGQWTLVGFAYDHLEATQSIYINGDDDAKCKHRPAFVGGDEPISIAETQVYGAFAGKIRRITIYPCDVGLEGVAEAYKKGPGPAEKDDDLFEDASKAVQRRALANEMAAEKDKQEKERAAELKAKMMQEMSEAKKKEI